MGRNVKREPAAAAADELTQEEVAESMAQVDERPTLEGGELGIPREVQGESEPVMRIPGMSPRPSAAEPEAPDAPKARRYVVKGGPEFVMYDGCRYPLKVGKVYGEHHVSLEKLRAQGVQLEELPPED